MFGPRWQLVSVWAAWVLLAGLARRTLGEWDRQDCQAMSREATGAARRCSRLLRRSLDPGYADCYQELAPSLPQDRKLTFAERLAVNICIEECNFIANGYVDVDPPYKLDFQRIYENVRKFVPKPQNESVQILLEALATCELFYHHHPKRMDIKFPSVDFLEQDCSPFATRIMSCATIYAMQESPANFVSATPACAAARAYFSQCVANVRHAAQAENTATVGFE